MTDKDREVLPSMNGDADLPERLWLYDDFTPDEDPPATDYASGLASLGFIGAALRRRVRLWCGIVVVGFVLGLAYFVVSPPAYQASTTVLLTHSLNENPTDAMSTDMTLAHSDTVATQALHQLRLNDPVSSFLSTVTVDNLTSRVLQIKVSAKSPADAANRAKAVAAAFLSVRASELENQQKLTEAALQQDVTDAQQHVNALNNQVSDLSGQQDAQSQAKLAQLKKQQTNAQAALEVLQQNDNGQQADSAANVAAQIKGSQVLDPAIAGHHSAAKFAIIYSVMGLVVGLVVGLAIVIIGALISDKLRRRDDIADSLGTSVNLSVGPLSASRIPLLSRRAKGAEHRDMQRVVSHLRDAIPDPESKGEAPALGLIPVDNGKTAARALVATALACAQDGQHVLIADLCPGAPAAHLLKAGDPGVRTVTVDGAELAVAVPAKDEVLPAGPVHRSRQGRSAVSTDEALVNAYSDADVLLTLVSLDPALGADHLRTWVGDTVVMVSAGRSSWLRIHAVGELVRLARIPLVSAILAEADQTDESIGLTQAAVRGTRVARANGL
ncbi:MAG TPA: Wzz/FepE/Etk N-terminal domain-containing protein [Streptosporangiaceae bacterium]